MIDFFSNYPYVKWILIGLGVLAILSKYLKFDPIDKLINRAVKKYKFEEFNHLNDEKLKHLVELFNQQNFTEVIEMFTGFGPSYRSFGFRALGQYGDMDVTDTWIAKEKNHELPKVIKSYQLVHKAWEVRGRGTIETVSKQNLAQFKKYLDQAKALLLTHQDESEYKLNIHALLLKVYKSIDIDRDVIHRTFSEVEVSGTNNAELNFNYFSAISLKWGGSKEEMDPYFNSMGDKSEFINNLILAQYYFDNVHLWDGKDANLKMKDFLEQAKSLRIDDSELYRYEFYLLLYWLSNNLEYDDLEDYYKRLTQPFVRD